MKSTIGILAKASLPILFCAGLTAQMPVEVKNGIRESIPVRDLSPQQAVVHKAAISFNGQSTGTLPGNFVVPAQKRLVIEYIVYSLHVPPGRSCLVRLQTTLGNVPVLTAFAPTHRLSLGNTELISGNQMTKLYAGAGTTVGLQVLADSVQGLSAVGEVAYHGYLVDMPLVFVQAQ